MSDLCLLPDGRCVVGTQQCSLQLWDTGSQRYLGRSQVGVCVCGVGGVKSRCLPVSVIKPCVCTLKSIHGREQVAACGGKVSHPARQPGSSAAANADVDPPLQEHSMTVMGIALSGDGQTLVTCSAHGLLSVWDMLRVQCQVRVHTPPWRHVNTWWHAFSPPLSVHSSSSKGTHMQTIMHHDGANHSCSKQQHLTGLSFWRLKW